MALKPLTVEIGTPGSLQRDVGCKEKTLIKSIHYKVCSTNIRCAIYSSVLKKLHPCARERSKRKSSKKTGCILSLN